MEQRKKQEKDTYYEKTKKIWTVMKPKTNFDFQFEKRKSDQTSQPKNHRKKWLNFNEKDLPLNFSLERKQIKIS